MEVEVAVLGSPSLTVLMVNADIKQHLKKNACLPACHCPLHSVNSTHSVPH